MTADQKAGASAPAILPAERLLQAAEEIEQEEMKPKSLAELLDAAATKAGSAAALARQIGITRAEISDLILGKRLVTTRQALRIEAVLGVSARDLLIEACIAKIDDALARARAQRGED